VGPLDGSTPPRRIAEVRGDEAHDHPAFGPDGREIYFMVTERGVTHVEAVPVAGGPRRRVLEDGTGGISFSPRGDLAAFLTLTRAPRSTPTFMDLATRKRRAPASELADTFFQMLVGVTWSASGARAAVVGGMGQVVEIDVASGKVTRQLDSGDQIVGATYVGEEIMISRVTWIGDIWVADL
jgi:hypothetical protein